MKILKILEIIWLVMGVIGVVMCGYYIIKKDNDASIYFLVFTIVSGLMYALRKRQRIKFEAAQQQKQAAQDKPNK